MVYTCPHRKDKLREGVHQISAYDNEMRKHENACWRRQSRIPCSRLRNRKTWSLLGHFKLFPRPFSESRLLWLLKLKIICLFCPPSLRNFLHLIISSNVSFRLWTFNFYHNLRPFHFKGGRLWGSTAVFFLIKKAAWLHVFCTCALYMRKFILQQRTWLWFISSLLFHYFAIVLY